MLRFDAEVNLYETTLSYSKMCESWRRVYEGSIHITATGFEEHCKF